MVRGNIFIKQLCRMIKNFKRRLYQIPYLNGGCASANSPLHFRRKGGAPDPLHPSLQIRALKRGHIVNQIKNIILLNWEHFLPQNLRGASPSPKSAREVRRYKRPRPMSALGSELRVPLEILRTSHYLEKFGMHLG